MLVSNEAGIQIVWNIIHTVQQNKDYLSQIDGEIGDGDHGVNMSKGFTIASTLLSQQQTDMSGGLSIIGKTLMTRIGGSIGPLYGTIFNEMAKAYAGARYIDANIVAKMLHSAIDSVSRISLARRGDKTMMDVLLPAVDAFETALAEGNDLVGALVKMKNAAELGMESTKDMVAKIGRSSRLGERSRGVIDAGATSLNLIIQSFADTLIALGQETK